MQNRPTSITAIAGIALDIGAKVNKGEMAW